MLASGGSRSSRCLTLSPDGSYEYHGEGSISASTAGADGASSASTSDAGHWSATGRTITARSNSGTVNTYPMVLRNHPQTGDPMICLDGDCYVTQFQRAPW